MKRFAFLLCLIALACQGNEEDQPEISVVVIETNLPDGIAPSCPYRYEAESATRACGDAMGPPHICSEIELCEAQRTYIFEAFASCELDEGSVDPDALPACP